ncbi:hypothetical protein TEA_020281 [Camellia sinensis var. sinensis]|uniref:Ninja-family protein n=1 Tax=Camellia sinensis var. sinensis TaxID=542762 RepID=A0A4S4ECZ7_CAMSN|nr:hypothetical protein TEA_020281 [Camellia sinensis var. sinensis]
MASNPTQLTNMSNEDEEIELNLGLSLGGRFGVDKSGNSKLIRSSSIASSIPIVRDGGDAIASAAAAGFASDTVEVGFASGGDRRGGVEEEEGVADVEKDGGEAAAVGETEEFEGQAKGNYIGVGGGGGGGGGEGGAGGFVQPSGSVESHGGSSSGMSESESRLFQGSSSCGEASPVSIRSLQEQGEQSNQEAVGSSSVKGKENACESNAETESSSKRPVEKRGGSMEDMPCVFTQGHGPNGRRIEGILYKYGKGEDVRIMCICHGSFLSPAEFVKHAGGTDVANPLKHIVVNPSSTPFL